MEAWIQLGIGAAMCGLWFVQWSDSVRVSRLEKDLRIAEHDIETIAATRKSYVRELED